MRHCTTDYMHTRQPLCRRVAVGVMCGCAHDIYPKRKRMFPRRGRVLTDKRSSKQKKSVYLQSQQIMHVRACAPRARRGSYPQTRLGMCTYRTVSYALRHPPSTARRCTSSNSSHTALWLSSTCTEGYTNITSPQLRTVRIGAWRTWIARDACSESHHSHEELRGPPPMRLRCCCAHLGLAAAATTQLTLSLIHI